MNTLPISAVIPTLNRTDRLILTIRSIVAQDYVPQEIIVIDASTPIPTLALGEIGSVRIVHRAASTRGAASQRNQGVSLATQPFILFLDDDIDLEPGCIHSLWQSLVRHPNVDIAGVVLTNQHYHPPGKIMRRLYSLLGCPSQGSLAGGFVGPALNFLPAPTNEDAWAQWSNLCCTLVRQIALPNPPLLPFFTGYSLLEDASLTAHISRKHGVIVPAGARAYHDYRPANYKDRVFPRETMEVKNRWFVMTKVLNRSHLGWTLRFIAYQTLMSLLSLRSLNGWRQFPASFGAKLNGAWQIIRHSHNWQGYDRA